MGAIACAAAIALALPPARPQETRAAPPHQARGAAAAPGLRVYRDPVTGQFGEPPPGSALAGAEAAGQGARLAPLRQRRSPVRGGGFIADLGGRFQSVVRASAGRDGLEVRCDTAGAAQGAGR